MTTRALMWQWRRAWGPGLVLAGALAVLPVHAAPVQPPVDGHPRPPAAGADRPPPTEAERAARREAHDKLRDEVMDQMRAMRMWRMTEELKLDQATAAKVFPLLAQYDEKAREIGRERMEIAREVHDQVRAGKPDDARLHVLIDKLLANQTKRNAFEFERFKALRPALSSLQQAKLLLLLPRLEDDFRRRIRDAMDAQREAEGMPPRSDRDPRADRLPAPTH